MRQRVIRLRSWRRLLPLAAIRSSAQLLVGRAFPQLGIFVAGVMVARDEGPRSYGLYSAAFALGSVIVGGGTAGLPILLLRRASEGDLDRPTLRRALRLQVRFSIVTIAFAALLGVAVLGGVRGARASVAAGFFFAANGVANLGQSVQSGRRRYHRAAATDAAAGTLFPILTYAALELNAGVNGALVAIAIACAISCAIAWTGLPDLEFDRESSRLRALDGISFNAFGLVHAGYGRIDTVMLAIVAGSAAAGYYSAGYRLLGPFHLIGGAFVTVYFSRLCEYSGNRERWTRVRRGGTLLLATIAIAGAAVLFLAAPQVIDLFYGSRYEDSVGPARILLLSIVPWALWWPKPSELASVHLERRVTAALGFGLALDFLLVAAVGSRFGATGAAWAWLGSESAVLIALSLMSRHIAERVGSSADAEAGARPTSSGSSRTL